jgi:hypothetical protein
MSNLSRKNELIVFVGYSAFPFGRAQVNRQYYLCKSLELAGFTIVVLNRHAAHSREKKIAPKGRHRNIIYYYCSGNPYLARSYLARKIDNLRGLLMEIYHICILAKTNRVRCFMVSTNYFHNLLIYYALSLWLRIPVINDVVELRSTFVCDTKLDRANNYLYDKLVARLSHGVIYISKYLYNYHLSSSNPNPSIIIPPISDYRLAQGQIGPDCSQLFSNQLTPNNYFLLCATIGHLDAILFSVRAFKLLHPSRFSLVLVTTKGNGFDYLINTVMSLGLNIVVLTDLSHSCLNLLYSRSIGLLAPLRKIPQDYARFPHKISEYLSSSRPVITTRLPEICRYLDDSCAMLCDDYLESEYAKAMSALSDSATLATMLGEAGRQRGCTYFNYIQYSGPLRDFTSLVKASIS